MEKAKKSIFGSGKMSQPERAAQNRIPDFFREEMGYAFLATGGISRGWERYTHFR